MGSLPNLLNHSWPTTREHQRKLTDAPLQVTSVDATYRGWCNDIGTGGMGITLAAPFKTGQHLEVEFTFPEETVTLKTTVVVRWSDGFRHGCEFLKPTAEMAQAIGSYISRPEKKPRKR
jgi:hypothetical protein